MSQALGCRAPWDVESLGMSKALGCRRPGHIECPGMSKDWECRRSGISKAWGCRVPGHAKSLVILSAAKDLACRGIPAGHRAIPADHAAGVRVALYRAGIRASSPEGSFGLRPQDDTGGRAERLGMPKALLCRKPVVPKASSCQKSCHPERSEGSGLRGHPRRPSRHPGRPCSGGCASPSTVRASAPHRREDPSRCSG